MQNFIVLGIIPGTSIRITFNFWLCTVVSLLCLVLMKNLWQRRATIRSFIIALMISRFIARGRLLA